MLFFFFKQKTAYEVCISDWSSDVCSSDLGPPRMPLARRPVMRARSGVALAFGFGGGFGRDLLVLGGRRGFDGRSGLGDGSGRSEEHTSELQSLMRLSYVVLCLNYKIRMTK